MLGSKQPTAAHIARRSTDPEETISRERYAPWCNAQIVDMSFDNLGHHGHL